jgi:hypothetical protein
MTWIPAGSNLYIHDTAPFLLERIDGNWILRDARDKTQAIPFSDIFNNPVFPIDLSNADVIVKTLQSLGSIVGQSLQILGNIVGNSIESLGAIVGDSLNITNNAQAKHFRGESANTPNSPAFSIQGDSNTGFYHISDGVFGWSSNGIKKGEFGADFGGFNGNIVQVISGTQNFQTVIATISFQNINSASGVVWETSIIPKLANSRIFILYYLSVVNSVSFSGYRVSNKINAGSYSVIYNPQIPSSQGAISLGVVSFNYNMLAIPVLHSPSYVKGDTLTYKVEGSSYDASTTQTTNVLRAGGNNGHSEVYIMEIANI